MGFVRYWVACFWRAFSVSFRGADRLDFVVPILVAGLAAALGYEVVLTLPSWALVLVFFSTHLVGRLLLVVTYQMWREQSDAANTANSRVERFERAWDRSGRNLVPMREALQLVSANLSDQWPDTLSDTQKLEKAARKIRELGHEGQIKIWGVEQILAPEVFREMQIDIPPSYWRKAEIILEYVLSGESTPDNPIAHTDEDHLIAESSIEDIPIYGDLRINRFALEAACPAAND